MLRMSPSPMCIRGLHTNPSRSRLNWYRFLGIFIGRALLDSRIIDVNLNMVFVQLILGMPVKQNIATLKHVDPQLARSLERLQTYLSARKEIESLPLVSIPSVLRLGVCVDFVGSIGKEKQAHDVDGRGCQLRRSISRFYLAWYQHRAQGKYSAANM